MKIYKYHKGEVHTLEVRECEGSCNGMLVNDRGYNAVFTMHVFHKEECSLSHDEAILKEKDRISKRIRMHSYALNKANAEMEELKKL